MVAMGFTPQNYPPYGEQPGWKRGSYGWHGDDARKFNSCPFGKEVRGEKPWNAGEVIGCGIRGQETKSIFYTRNGRFVDDFWMLRAENNELLYPSIGLDRQGLAIRVNLGKSPFLFDLSSLAEKADMDGPVPFILTDDFSDTESEGADVVGLWQYADSSDEEEESSDTHDSGNEEDESSDEESNISHTESEGQDVEEANAGGTGPEAIDHGDSGPGGSPPGDAL
mmetsp:Transcript_5678/g.8740  ORF Transcript_5678/g.8740 Transcript_5678/m.8740 type:complete len:224 (-) Transcript_5678:1144-1815(-)